MLPRDPRKWITFFCLSIPSPNFFCHTPILWSQWCGFFPYIHHGLRDWFLVLNHVQPFPRWNEEDSGQSNMLCIKKSLVFRPATSLGDTWNWQQKYRESRLETRKKKRLATPWFPASIFPTDSDRKASFCRQLGVLPSCSSDDRPWPSGGSFDGNSHRPGGTCTPRWKSKGHFPRPPVTTFFPSRRRCQTWFGGK